MTSDTTTVPDEIASPAVPHGWAAQERQTLEHARVRTLRALDLPGEAGAAHRLTRFYDVITDYAGATFATLAPNDPQAYTCTDLMATTLLSVEIKATAVRRLLEPGPQRTAISAALADLPTELRLEEATGGCSARCQGYTQVKQALSRPHVKNPNAWVVASKLWARKRPGLFPLRDRAVCHYLGVLSHASAAYDWRVFRHLMADPDV